MTRPYAQTHKKLLGKTVEVVRMNTFDDGRGGVAVDPVIVFSDGTILRFTVSETNVGRYGVNLNVSYGVKPSTWRQRKNRAKKRAARSSDEAETASCWPASMSCKTLSGR